SVRSLTYHNHTSSFSPHPTHQPSGPLDHSYRHHRPSQTHSFRHHRPSQTHSFRHHRPSQTHSFRHHRPSQTPQTITDTQLQTPQTITDTQFQHTLLQSNTGAITVLTATALPAGRNRQLHYTLYSEHALFSSPPVTDQDRKSGC